MPGARRFSELGPVSPADSLPTPEQVLETPRSLQAPEVTEPAAELKDGTEPPPEEPQDKAA